LGGSYVFWNHDVARGMDYCILRSCFIGLCTVFIVGVIAEPLQEPYRAIVNVAGSFVVAPSLVSYLYNRKMKNTGRGSAIFWIYCGFFIFIFIPPF
ncbi:MAG: hypothetical protein KAG66_12920, partial [Methylococcales bacterium]|nr:hypothetical protein [Methylococcales bacterium]